jgi:hypothetical protein
MKPRPCDICGEEYTPRTPRQIVCPICRGMPLKEFFKKHGMTKNEMLIKVNK